MVFVFIGQAVAHFCCIFYGLAFRLKVNSSGVRRCHPKSVCFIWVIVRRTGFIADFHSNANWAIRVGIGRNLHQIIAGRHTGVVGVAPGNNGCKFCTNSSIVGQTGIGFVHRKSHIARCYCIARLRKCDAHRPNGGQRKFEPNRFVVEACHKNGGCKRLPCLHSGVCDIGLRRREITQAEARVCNSDGFCAGAIVVGWGLCSNLLVA